MIRGCPVQGSFTLTVMVGVGTIQARNVNERCG
jgi:hypothetical protein